VDEEKTLLTGFEIATTYKYDRGSLAYGPAIPVLRIKINDGDQEDYHDIPLQELADELRPFLFVVGNRRADAKDEGEAAWISVDTRLPEVDQVVLVAEAYSPQASIALLVERHGRKEWWLGDEGFPEDKENPVTHWQPLPDPPPPKDTP